MEGAQENTSRFVTEQKAQLEKLKDTGRARVFTKMVQHSGHDDLTASFLNAACNELK